MNNLLSDDEQASKRLAKHHSFVRPDGTHVKTYRRRRSLPDGSSYSKSRIEEIFPGEGLNENCCGTAKPKAIETTTEHIRRDGPSYSTKSTQITILSRILKQAAPEGIRNLESHESRVHHCILNDGTRLLVSKTADDLQDGSSKMKTTQVNIASTKTRPNLVAGSVYLADWQSDDDARQKKRLKIECCGAEKIDLESIISDENVVPTAFLSCARGDDGTKKISELESARRIDIPETVENNEAPMPLYHLSERTKMQFFLEKQKAKKTNYRDETHNHTPWYLHSSDERHNNVSIDTNKSICPSSKDHFSIESTDTELAVARPVSDFEYDKPIYEATEYAPKPPFYKSMRCQVYTALALLFLSAVVAVAVVFGTKPYVPLCCAYHNVTQTPTMKHSELLIREAIENHVLQRNVTFQDMKNTDRRNLALKWILHDDDMQVTVDDANLLQRYILALLAFSFDLFSWNCGFVYGLDSCLEWEWDYNETDSSPYDYTLWLSGTDECLWYGVSCVRGVVRGLDLTYNNLIGKIPPEIGKLSLESLSLGGNCLYGTIPPEMWQLHNLTHLDLELNALSGLVVSDELYHLTSLVSLKLAQNLNAGSCNHTDGTETNVASDGLEGRIFNPQIGQLRHLKEISVDTNSFDGTISSEIGKLNHLEILYANTNQFTGTFPGEITNLVNIREMFLDSNNITGELPSRLGDLLRLEYLSVYGNVISGSIPDSLYKLRQLKNLWLNDNRFEGTIKSEVGHLLQLERLVLKDNPSLSGTLPSELGLCENLMQLLVQNTGIVGPVPDEVCLLREKNLLVPTHSLP